MSWNERMEQEWTQRLAAAMAGKDAKRALMKEIRQRMTALIQLLKDKGAKHLHANTCGLKEWTYDDYWDGISSDMYYWCGELSVSIEPDGMWRIYHNVFPWRHPELADDSNILNVVEEHLLMILGKAAQAESQLATGETP